MLNIRPLPEDLQKIACEELNEVPERIEQDIKVFKEWIQSQTHLHGRTDDQYLIGFLRGCKHSMEKAKFKYENFYTLKTKYPDLRTIKNFDDPKMLKLLEMGIGLSLPTPLNDNGPRIHYVRIGLFPIDKYDISELMCWIATLESSTIQTDDYCVINGYVTIVDLSNFTSSHMLQFTPSLLKKMITFSQEAVPLRQRAIHGINASPVFERLYNLVKSMLPESKQERFYLHGNNLQSLYEFIPLKYLPIELGGQNGTFDEINQNSMKLIRECRDFFIEESTFGVNEDLRLDKTNNYDQVFGAEGSFRKLEVD